MKPSSCESEPGFVFSSPSFDPELCHERFKTAVPVGKLPGRGVDPLACFSRFRHQKPERLKSMHATARPGRPAATAAAAAAARKIRSGVAFRSNNLRMTFGLRPS